LERFSLRRDGHFAANKRAVNTLTRRRVSAQTLQKSPTKFLNAGGPAIRFNNPVPYSQRFSAPFSRLIGPLGRAFFTTTLSKIPAPSVKINEWVDILYNS
jgi:hypothetical protein